MPPPSKSDKVILIGKNSLDTKKTKHFYHSKAIVTLNRIVCFGHIPSDIFVSFPIIVKE